MELPVLWIFAVFVSPVVGAAIGALFLAGRAIYFTSDVEGPSSWSAGFPMGFFANVVLIVGGIGCAIASLR